jgi:polysaccharide biosynthesis protein PslG
MMVGRKARLVAAVVLATITASAWTGTAGAAVPKDFFGVIPSGFDSQAEIQRMAQNGVGAVRVQINWNFVEPHPGTRDWSGYDGYIAEFAAAGIQVQPVLWQVPPWISPHVSHPPISNSYQRRSWQSFLTDLAARYGRNGLFWRQHPNIPYMPLTDWEVWNEPNLTGFWDARPNPRQFVRLLRISGTALHRGDPQARIGIGGIFPPPRAHYGVSMDDFLKGIYRVHGARSAFDAVAIHPYASRPKGVLAYCRQMRRILNRHGDGGTPMWVTEVGWSTGGVRLKTSPFRATESSQAKFLTRTYDLLIAHRFGLDLERVVWHTWQDYLPSLPWTYHMGLIRFDESAKPALAAYAALPR